MNNKEQEKCIHQKTDRYQLTSNFYLCFHCSSAIINNGSHNEVSTVKPRKYSVILENSIPIFLSIFDTHKSYSFLNKEDYMSIRIIFIKQMKVFIDVVTQINCSQSTMLAILDTPAMSQTSFGHYG